MKVPILDRVVAFALDLQKLRDRWNLFHFSMRLHPEFEAQYGNYYKSSSTFWSH